MAKRPYIYVMLGLGESTYRSTHNIQGTHTRFRGYKTKYSGFSVVWYVSVARSYKKHLPHADPLWRSAFLMLV